MEKCGWLCGSCCDNVTSTIDAVIRFQVEKGFLIVFDEWKNEARWMGKSYFVIAMARDVNGF